MKVELIDYRNKRVALEIPEKEEMLMAFIEVLSGDETLIVVTKDGEPHRYDSSDSRIADFTDSLYVVFGGPINLFDDPKWLGRTDSYSYHSYQIQGG